MQRKILMAERPPDSTGNIPMEREKSVKPWMGEQSRKTIPTGGIPSLGCVSSVVNVLNVWDLHNVNTHKQKGVQFWKAIGEQIYLVTLHVMLGEISTIVFVLLPWRFLSCKTRKYLNRISCSRDTNLVFLNPHSRFRHVNTDKNYVTCKTKHEVVSLVKRTGNLKGKIPGVCRGLNFDVHCWTFPAR